MGVKKDCYAYKNGGCYCLNELYCAKGECSFYNTDLKIEDIEKEIKQYYQNRTAEIELIRKNLKKAMEIIFDLDLTDLSHRLKSQQQINKVYKTIEDLDTYFDKQIKNIQGKENK